MRRNREPAPLVNDVADFARGFSFQVRQLSADAQQVAVGGGDFDSGQNEKTVHGLTVEPHQSFFEHVGDSVAGVVIRYGNAMQTFRLGSADQIFRTRNAVAGEKRMSVEIEIEGHARRNYVGPLEMESIGFEKERFGGRTRREQTGTLSSEGDFAGARRRDRFVEFGI